MSFELIPVAEASIGTLMNSIDRVIINPIIVLLFAIAVVYFVYGVLNFLMHPDNEEIRKSSKSHMVWGIVGLFIMVTVFGIMRLILNTVGERKVKIDNTGQIQIDR